jgi:hypothetical protein
MRSNTTPDGAGIRVGSILHKYANAQSVLASEELMAGSKQKRSRLRVRYQLAISPTNFINSFSTISLLTCASL